MEFGCFSPLVFSTAGGLGPIATCTTTFKRIASLLSGKLEKPYSIIMNYIRCEISFSLLRSTINCLRGTHSVNYDDCTLNTMDLALTEGRVSGALN